MEDTRIIQLNIGGGPMLYLLGGDYHLSDYAGKITPGVWQLEWNTTSQSYYWEDRLHPPMGGLHLLHSSTPPYREGV